MRLWKVYANDGFSDYSNEIAILDHKPSGEECKEFADAFFRQWGMYTRILVSEEPTQGGER